MMTYDVTMIMITTMYACFHHNPHLCELEFHPLTNNNNNYNVAKQICTS